jgi:hypothetical protein
VEKRHKGKRKREGKGGTSKAAIGKEEERRKKRNQWRSGRKERGDKGEERKPVKN